MGYEPYRMLTLRIETWDEFYRLAASFLADKRQWVFRGHTSAEWELKHHLNARMPSLKERVMATGYRPHPDNIHHPALRQARMNRLRRLRY